VQSWWFSLIKETFDPIIYNNMMDTSLSRNFPLGIQFAALAMIFLISNLIGGLFVVLLESQAGFSIRETNLDILVENRMALRMLLFLSNAFMFIFPGIFFSILLYRKKWLVSVKAHRLPSFFSILISLLLILLSVGMVAYSFKLNSMIPLPDWMMESEQSSQSLITAALTMDHWGELFINLFIVALIPAIGEEWIFRGILQDRLLQKIKNEHLAVWLVAILFSAIHMQFQGFLPRMLLGAILGYMFVWSGSLWLPIIVHFFNNAYQVISYFLKQTAANGEEIDVSQMPEISGLHALLSLIGVVGLMLVLRFIHNKSTVQT